jgi:hypothetical protein
MKLIELNIKLKDLEQQIDNNIEMLNRFENSNMYSPDLLNKVCAKLSILNIQKQQVLGELNNLELELSN